MGPPAEGGLRFSCRERGDHPTEGTLVKGRCACQGGKSLPRGERTRTELGKSRRHKGQHSLVEKETTIRPKVRSGGVAKLMNVSREGQSFWQGKERRAKGRRTGGGHRLRGNPVKRRGRCETFSNTVTSPERGAMRREGSYPSQMFQWWVRTLGFSRCQSSPFL